VSKNNRVKKIGLASDHAGFRLKKFLKERFESEGYEVQDFGCDSADSCDYPDYAHPLAISLLKKEFDVGFTMCGSGNGINMVVNKHNGIRSAICWNKEMTQLARSHNDANICSIPARFISQEIAWQVCKIFLDTEFDGGRHKRRIDKIPWKE
jgi:ribose 5-phosphate isomerase B